MEKKEVSQSGVEAKPEIKATTGQQPYTKEFKDQLVEILKINQFLTTRVSFPSFSHDKIPKAISRSVNWCDTVTTIVMVTCC